MNKAAIKTYAVWARNELISRVSQKAYEYGITKENVVDINADSINGKLLSSLEKKQRQELINEIKNKGFEQVMEEVAYTWFNRFIALRFMEVNNYLPNKIRLFTNENNEFEPQILQEAISIDLDTLDKNKVFELVDKNNNEELYKILLLTTCNDMSKYLPGMFTKIDEYKTLLFPGNLLKKDSVIGEMVSSIDEDDWRDQVQIIGWFYQFYNIDPKNKVNSKKSGEKIKKEEIPAVTQLFTPDWIVRYMTENSLGRFWLDGHKNNNIKSNWKYYIDETVQNDIAYAKFDSIKIEHGSYSPEKIKFIDPCMGSGHILVYAFDIFMQIYISEGWTEKDAAKSILENNLFGLDIDDRAYQLSYFALMMKARQYSRKILTENIKLNIMSINESPKINRGILEKFGDLKPLAEVLLDSFTDAKELGSIIDVNVTLNELEKLDEKLNDIDKMADYGNLVDQLESLEIISTFEPLIKQAKILTQKYEIVVTNPPYRPVSDLSSVVQEYAKSYYPNSKTDLFAIFMDKARNLLKLNGYYGMINMHSWMFLSSYEKFRNSLFESNTLINMVHLGSKAFEEINGEVVQTTSFVICNNSINEYDATYLRLVDYNNQQRKEHAFAEKKDIFNSRITNYKKIPGSPVAYWANNHIIEIYNNNNLLGNISRPRIGQNTGDNNRFIRLWSEVDNNKLFIGLKHDQLSSEKYKWLPYNKGGSFRKWYGNQDYVVNWENDGKEIKDYAVIRNHGKHWSRYIQNIENMCKSGITWSFVSSSFGVRYLPEGFICDVGGSAIFPNKEKIMGICALLNSKITNYILKILNPTINYQAGNIASIPYNDKINDNERINSLSTECINLSRIDWDSFETSWDFLKHPFMKYIAKTKEERLVVNSCGDKSYISPIQYSYDNWSFECDERFNKLKINEEELNKQFIEIYGLNDELCPNVEDKDVTVRIADLKRDIKSFISYAVGCMFGRYSLDKDGLVFAGGEWKKDDYKTFIPDNDNIIPICDDEYFEDDITGKFIKFVATVYGEDTLEENLSYIAEALGKSGNPRKAIRDYFLNDFFNDHCNTYQVTGSGKRPIYWLFDSGKKNGFKALVYIHRYTPDLIAKMRIDYVHEQQSRYRTQISMLENQIENSDSSNEKIQYQKQLEKIKDQAEELRIYEEKIHHWADKMEPMDLDDGVKANYAKFQDLLAKIK